MTKTRTEFLAEAKRQADALDGKDCLNPQFNLGQLRVMLDFLCASGYADLYWPECFRDPDSYRGIYCEVAFEPAEYLTTWQINEQVVSAIGSTYMGYKGGEFYMDVDAPVWIAPYSHTGTALFESDLIRMFALALSEGSYKT